MKRCLAPSLALISAILLAPMAGDAQTSGEIIPRRYLVTFRADTPAPVLAAQELGRAHGFRVRHVYRFALRGMAIEVPAAAELQVLAALRRDPRVRAIGNDRTVVAHGQINPKGLRRIKGEPGVGANTGSGLRVAVVDTGLDFTHADLAAHIDTSLSISCVTDNGNCIPGGQDDNGHGTFVGGIIAALNNDIDIVGLGPEITLVAVKVLKSSGSGAFTDIVAALDYLTGLNQAGTRIDVVNMSLGATCSQCTDNSTDPTLVAFHDAIRALVQSGTTVVVSSGNDGQDARTSVPASYDEVITTSAIVDSDGQPGGFGPPLCVAPFMGFCFGYGDDDSFAAFANFGSDVDVTGPGVEETSLKLGGGTINGANGSGTSFSSPHAAGVAALLIRDRLNRGEPPPEPGIVREALIETGECYEGAGSVFHGTLGCAEVWPGDADGRAEPLVRADNIANFGGPAQVNDVAVTSISVPPIVQVNTTESVDVGVANQGTQEETFSVSLSDGAEPFSVGGSPQSVTLAAGASTTVSFSWNPNALGDHSLTATASTVTGETDTADNQKVVTVSVLEPTHDVAVTLVTAPASVVQGVTANISVEVANQGTFDEIVTVSLADLPPAGGTAGSVSGDQTLTLTSGSSATLTFVWDTSGATLGVHTLSATAATVPGENDTADNTSSRNSSVAEPPPVAPGSLVATAVSSSRIDLTWTDLADNEQGFRLERCQGGASACDSNPGRFAQIAELGANSTAYSDTSVSSVQTYSYRVRAFNAAGNSAYSNTAQATTPSGPPAAPSNLVATAVSSAQIGLVWQDNSSNEINMRIDRCMGTAAFCDANPGNFVEITQLGANITSYSNAGLSPETTYSYRVRATNSSGSSAPSNTAEATTQPVSGPPAAPSNLVAIPSSTTKIKLTWQDNSFDEEGFRIERCQGAGCTAFVQVVELPANTSLHFDDGLLAATTYSYRVRAFNVAGNSGYSNTAEGTTNAPPAPPAAPSNLVATAFSSTRIDLVWQDNSTNEINMRIDRCVGTAAFCDANPGNFVEITQLGANNTFYSNTGLNPDTTYSYRVRATNSNGSSDPSNTAEATTQAVAAPPAAPSNLVATVVSSTQINLVWQDNSSNEINMRIDRCVGTATFCDANPGNFVEIAQLGANSTSYSNTGLNPETTYSYRVRATNSSGSSDPSNTAEATTQSALTPPAAPSNLTATAGGGGKGKNAQPAFVDMIWQDNSSNENSFVLERCSVEGTGRNKTCSFGILATLGADTVTYHDASVAGKSKYRYRAKATNSAGGSAYSNEVEVTTP